MVNRTAEGRLCAMLLFLIASIQEGAIKAGLAVLLNPYAFKGERSWLGSAMYFYRYLPP